MAFKKTNKSEEIKYKILEEVATVSESNGWELKIRYMSWNGNDPKYDGFQRVWILVENFQFLWTKLISCHGYSASRV